ncbi:hypothetical protein RchiOBHm_Chr2g0092071 [Rosa chinensis]|uniref:Uncharacterized protein n=1 Tax=Rosa chinensis TaxID=74649 RepID=A0A2P6RJX3_ROSCH|nr:hypothetical protein RchiOBHm_Chr2g0092071 [Rosa chinensis]
MQFSIYHIFIKSTSLGHPHRKPIFFLQFFPLPRLSSIRSSSPNGMISSEAKQRKEVEDDEEEEEGP